MPEVYPDQDVNVGQLSEEVAVLDLPDFTGVARLHRVPNRDGVWKSAPPYVLVKVGKLTASRKRSLDAVLAAHVPEPVVRLKTELDRLEERVAALETK